MLGWPSANSLAIHDGVPIVSPGGSVPIAPLHSTVGRFAGGYYQAQATQSFPLTAAPLLVARTSRTLYTRRLRGACFCGSVIFFPPRLRGTALDATSHPGGRDELDDALARRHRDIS